MKKTRVLIVDDHAILRMGLASLLNGKGDLEVVGDAADGESGIARALELRPDIIILDLVMPGIDGAETTKRLLAAWPEARVLILTTFGTADALAVAIEAGAYGAVMKNVDFSDLVDAIRAIADGKRYLAPEIAGMLKTTTPVQPLSPRQAEILRLIVDGKSNPEIADALDISVDMVKEHALALFRKIGAANRAEAVAIALRRHLL